MKIFYKAKHSRVYDFCEYVTGSWTAEWEALVCVSGMFWVLWVDEDVD